MEEEGRETRGKESQKQGAGRDILRGKHVFFRGC